MNKGQILQAVARGDMSPEEAGRKLDSLKRQPKGKARDAEFAALFAKAHEAGMAAGQACTPTPMVVQQHASPLDDSSPVTQQWHVPDGACGFAWVKIGDARQPFCRWLKRTGKVRDRSYGGGYSIWVSEFGQSIARKEAYARAFAKVLQEGGIQRVYADSRLD